MVSIWSRRSFVKSASVAALATRTRWLNSSSANLSLKSSDKLHRFAFVGTQGHGKMQGISTYTLEHGKGETWTKEHFVFSEAPISIVLGPSGKSLYVLNEVQRFEALPRGSIEAYQVDLANGELELLNRQPLSLSATMPRQLAVSPDGNKLAVAVHGGGAYNVLPILQDGSLGPVVGILKETGSGPNHQFQNAAHPHSVAFNSSGDRIFTADIGTDCINLLALNDQGCLEVVMRHQMPSGSGPSQIALHPNGRFLYVGNYLVGSVDGLIFDPRSATLAHFNLDAKVKLNGSGCTALEIDPRGNFLYVASGNALSIWRIDPETGSLSYRQSLSSQWGDLQGLLPTADGLQILALVSEGVIRTKMNNRGEKMGATSLVASLSGARCIAMC